MILLVQQRTVLSCMCFVKSYQSPIFHRSTREVCDGNAIIFGQRVADAEEVLVERNGFDADI
jgi:hypothetical protein